MGVPSREVFLDGIHIKVFSKKREFDVVITIEPRTFLWKKRECKLCKVVFHTDQDNKTLHERATFKLTGQKYDKKHLSNVFKTTLDLPNVGTCTVILKPAFFLSKSLREQYWKEREGEESIFAKEQLSSKRTQSFVGICSGPRGKSGKGIHYSNNNVNKPYQGGKCSPK